MRKQWVLAGILAGSLRRPARARAAQGAEPAADDRRGAGRADAASWRSAPSACRRRDRGRQGAAGRHLPGASDGRGSEARRARAQPKQLERWVEFVQKGAGQGPRGRLDRARRPKSRTSSKDAPPPAGGSKVQLLKGNDYVRVWINKGGNHYLIHLPTGATATQ